MANHPAAELEGISKRFGATQALDDVSLSPLGGEIHALVGENGAGKSTLVKILAGVHAPDAGHIRLGGIDWPSLRRQTWREQRARTYGIRPDQLEEHYRARTTLKVNVLPEDVAEAVFFLASDRSAKSTGTC